MRTVYLLGAIVGAVVPLVFLGLFVAESGLTLTSFARALYANHAAGMFSTDLLISSFVFWVFFFREGAARGMSHLWVYVACNLAIGLSLALPLFLYVRKQHLRGQGSD